MAANVRLPAYSEMEILAESSDLVQENQVYVLEGVELKTTSVMVARAIVTPGVSVPVRVMNVTDQPVNLYKGTRIAHLTEIEEVDDNPLLVSSVQHDGNVSFELEAALWALAEQATLEPEDQERLFVLLLEYADVFALGNDGLGRTSILQHEIHTGDAAPIRQQFRRVCPEKRQEMRTLLSEMLERDIIRPSNSPWASPVVLVKKKDGTSRFCIDYRKVNTVTRKDAYPLPRLDDLLDTLAGSRLFSTLDLVSGYWQVEIHPRDKQKTAFCTSEGLYEFNVMPFGLCNGPATFQRLMNLLLAGVQWSSCLVYLDDIIVLGRTFEDHLKHLSQVFQRLREAKLKLKVKKCSFCRETVQFLGHVVSSQGVTADPAKIQKVVDWPVPTNKCEVQQFLGLVSYYRRFIRNCAEMAKPLHQLTERSKPFCWTDNCDQAFKRLKEQLTTPPVLVFPDFSREFLLDTDASDHGIGAVLSQVHSDGQERVVAYASRLLSKSERRYCVTRKELLAVVVFLHHFRQYLLGKTFILRTDHNSLVWLRNFKEPEGQLARWLERLEEFQFEVVHRRGKTHCNADALSRLSSHQSNDTSAVLPIATIALTAVLRSRSHQDIRNHQLEDELIGPIFRAKIDGVKPSVEDITGCDPKYRKLVQIWDQLVLRDELLWRLFENNDNTGCIYQLVIPSSLKTEVLHDIHEGVLGGHLGVDKSLGKLKERFYWPGHYNDVRQWCASCVSCATRKSGGPTRRGPLQPIVVGYPLQLVAVDILGPLPRSSAGNSYILVAEDYFTRWLEAWPIPNQEAKTVALKLVNEMFFRFSLPDQILSDQGRQFESAIMDELCKLLQIQKSRTTPYHPQGDGLVERSNRTLLNMLSIVVEDHPDTWESHLRPVCMAYNTSIQPTTGYSPFFLMFGRKARLPIDIAYGTNQPQRQTISGFIGDMRTVLENVYRQVRDTMGLKQDRQKELYDRKRHGKFYEVGDLVWLHSSVIPHGASRKLHRPWTGPYKIIKKLADITYRVQSCKGRRRRLVVHFDRLKPCSKDMRIDESVPEQIVSPTVHDSERKSLEQIAPPIIYDLEDDDGVPEQGKGNSHHPHIADVPVAGDDHQDVPATVDGHQERSPPVAFPMADSDTRRYPGRSHRPPQRYADYVAL